MSDINTVAVLGAGTMGHGIAQVCAAAGCSVRLYDINDEAVASGAARIEGNLNKGIDRGKVTENERDAVLNRLTTTTLIAEAVTGADLVVEAAPESIELKAKIFSAVDAAAPDHALLASNTSSLSIAQIASAVADPTRVVGMHFFNPVHIMKLLEIIVHDGTRPEVLEACRAFGAAIGKECITVNDFPGFATSRLGVCLGMEAIRMVEQGVASPEDIDTAMVLGYRHPIGPLKLTDLVGLDVRMHIGEYLAGELGNEAFRPPKLMRDMVADGRLGKKSGHGFYEWD